MDDLLDVIDLFMYNFRLDMIWLAKIKQLIFFMHVKGYV
jgi:hypothetical protein